MSTNTKAPHPLQGLTDEGERLGLYGAAAPAPAPEAAQAVPADYQRGWDACMSVWADHMKRMKEALEKPLPRGWANHAHHIQKNVMEVLAAAPAAPAPQAQAAGQEPGPGIDTLAAVSAALAQRQPLTASDVQWIVNDNAELGVFIRGQAFFLYKGNSLVYESGLHDDGTPMHYRPVLKREFGECCHPVNYSDPTRIGTVSLDDSDAWMPLPAAPGATTGEQRNA